MKRLQDQLMEYNDSIEELKSAHKLLPAVKGREETKRTELVEITYVPSRNALSLSESDEVAIVSEFTGWEQKRMSREVRNGEAVYVGKYPLQTGFKYKFRFIVNGNRVNDIGYETTKNTLGQSYNYIVVPGDIGMPLVKHKSYINPSIESQVRQEAMKKYFGPLKFTKENGEPVKDNLSDCIGRLLYKYKEPEGLFKLVKWDEEDKEATLKRLTDSHTVPLDLSFHTKQEYLFLNELKTQFFLVKASEEQSVLSAVAANRLKINYKMRKDPNAPAGQLAVYYDTVSVEPENIPIQDVALALLVVHH